MIYLDSDFNDYKYFVKASDNYIVLSKQSHVLGDWNNPDTCDVIYQYINPSITTIKTTYSSYNTEYFDNISTQISNSIFDRADFPQIFICNFIIFLIFAFVVNQLTKFIYKGGVFGAS